MYWTPGLTPAGLAEEALGKEVDKMEKEQGQLFRRERKSLGEGC